MVEEEKGEGETCNGETTKGGEEEESWMPMQFEFILSIADSIVNDRLIKDYGDYIKFVQNIVKGDIDNIIDDCKASFEN
jgi:hypothetical protein